MLVEICSSFVVAYAVVVVVVVLRNDHDYLIVELSIISILRQCRSVTISTRISHRCVCVYA